jgi:SAM-dependent methyltransferase
MTPKFNRVAQLYNSSLPLLPDEYCQLIQTHFALDGNDKIIDLGCGAGYLTFGLSRFSKHVEGVDVSRKMIEIAQDRDKEKRIKWICRSIENFDFGSENYSLIISYESFHLFSNTSELVKKCTQGLRPGGFFCVGWCLFQWEEILKDIITDTFKSFGIDWGKWGFQRCINFFSAVEHMNKCLSPIVEDTIRVQTKTNIRNIALYLGSIEKSATLEIDVRTALTKELEKVFRKHLSSEWVEGVTSYSLAYTKKI